MNRLMVKRRLLAGLLRESFFHEGCVPLTIFFILESRSIVKDEEKDVSEIDVIGTKERETKNKKTKNGRMGRKKTGGQIKRGK